MAKKNDFSLVRAQIGDAEANWRAKCARTVKGLTVQALADAQTLSPVDTGRYRSAHALSVGEPSKLLPKEPKNKGAAEAAAAFEAGAKSVAEGVTPDDFKKQGVVLTVFLTNNLAYAGALENGHSQQAPKGVLGLVRDKAVQRAKKVGVKISAAKEVKAPT